MQGIPIHRMHGIHKSFRKKGKFHWYYTCNYKYKYEKTGEKHSDILDW